MNENKGLGANLNTEDNRDIPFSLAAAALGVAVTTHPKKNITDVSMLPIEDQKDKGTCVGQAEGKDAEFKEYLESGKVTRLSKRLLYKLCKDQDGSPNEQGTYPRIAAAIRVSIGLAKEASVPDDNDLPYNSYMEVTLTDEIKTEASAYRSKGYSFVNSLEELKTAIDVFKAFNATLFVGDWNSLPVKPKYSNGKDRGTHRIWVIGYEDAKNGKLDDTKVYYLNSWGIKWAKGKNSADRKLLEKGIGYFWWSEYQPNYFRDGIVYMDMPNEIIDYVKNQQYIFPRELERDMSGTDVMELQKRLDKEIAFDGKKCYVASYYDVSFGVLTEKSVQRYQKTKGIVSSGTPSTTGYGRVGKKTLAALNNTADPAKPGVMLGKWADAIQMFEGWYPAGSAGYPNGSKSWRNNNPGNIRYIGQKRATGQDSTGFCIFATYDDGRAELIDLLTRAATGKSTIYKPDMTLLEFYQRYAPTSDGNYPASYASAVAKFIGVSINSKIKDIYAGTATAAGTVKGVKTIHMKNITSSALKIVLLFLVVLLGLLTAFSVVFDITHGAFNDITKTLLASFTAAITLVLGFYFGSPNDNGGDNGGLAGSGK